MDARTGRHFFEYRTLKPVLNFFSVLSARYAVVRDRWNDVALGIYYQPGHEYNLDKMMKGDEGGARLLHDQLRPVPEPAVPDRRVPALRELRAVVPEHDSVTRSPSASSPGCDPNDPKDIDYPYYVTAHEVAHQWWAHQVIGGNVQGSTMLSESLAQYSALMVMKRKTGPAKMRRFLNYELNSYLRGRAFEQKKELPLARVENQPYIHYNKGSLSCMRCRTTSARTT